ncbi:helix-turn-helix domain-containing protein [Xenorhabdus sp. XENO-10]|uniref:Helix-turn-helix domain-containing protein n=1 Tax=Xenorhabdus yunnanensis TaxID=3025878 RepID=A0ABT5LQ17_9GAMM|nr:helix-turn-helix domain-containing protein [Xenorhabdus yunnanensis]MDC9591855.1 helix-turn-helix domain-containing protein [Xenorhabdus yunnanensis]
MLRLICESKKGFNITTLSYKYGYKSNILRSALFSHYPKAEYIIAEFLDVHPSEIWPNRYFDELGNLTVKELVKERYERKNEINEQQYEIKNDWCTTNVIRALAEQNTTLTKWSRIQNVDWS